MAAPLLLALFLGRRGRCRDAVCYVDGNLIVALDRKEREAIDFARRNAGCLYTVAQIMDIDVSGAREVALRHGIQYRWVSKSVYEAIEVEAARLVALLERDGWTLNDRQVRDARHLAAARVTGARFLVTGEELICRWAELYYGGRPACIDWRGGWCG